MAGGFVFLGELLIPIRIIFLAYFPIPVRRLRPLSGATNVLTNPDFMVIFKDYSRMAAMTLDYDVIVVGAAQAERRRRGFVPRPG